MTKVANWRPNNHHCLARQLLSRLANSFIRDRLQNNESVILPVSNETQQVVGFCQLYPTFCSVEAKPIYSLYDLFVIKEARRLGIGKILLQAAEKLAIKNRQSENRPDYCENQRRSASYVRITWVDSR